MITVLFVVSIAFMTIYAGVMTAWSYLLVRWHNEQINKLEIENAMLREDFEALRQRCEWFERRRDWLYTIIGNPRIVGSDEN